MKPSANTLFIILTAVIIAGGAFAYIWKSNSSDRSVTPTEVQSTSQAHFQTLVAELENISFKTELLKDPRFLALTDITTPVAPEPFGRTDPFAPIAGVSAQ